MHSGGFSPGRKKPVRQNPRDQSAVTSTARAPVEAWIFEERSRAKNLDSRELLCFQDFACAEISSVITAMIGSSQIIVGKW
jgi:hypothetical protein